MKLDAGSDQGLRSPQPRAVRELALATTLLGLNAWIAAGSFESIARDGAPVEYMLVTPSFATLALFVAAAGAAVFALLFLGRRQLSPAVALLSVQTTRHLRPLRWTAISLLPLALLVLPSSLRLEPLTFVLMDLRWAWWGFLLFVVCRNATATRAVEGRSASAIALLTVVALPIAVSVAATPHLRFSGALHGDEPKYIRYVENFYQGRGFDIANKPHLVDAPEPRLAANLGHLARAVPEELASLLSDLRYAITRRGTPPRSSEEPGEGMVFGGKYPGTVYQLHNPGLSFLLFPGYVIDRLWTGSGIGYGGEFPERMPATYVSLLALFAGFSLALFALLGALGHERPRAVALALVGVLTLPAGAFAFQIYPEVAAGLALALLVRAPLAMPQRATTAAGYGILCGFLPWLHVRFALATLVAAAAFLVAPEGGHSRRRAFAVGALIALASLALYTYRLTGSLIPIATYGSDTPLSLTRTLIGVPALLLDRVWGLLPHTPLFLLASPGVGALWRRSRPTTVAVLAVGAAVMVPAAGHGFWAGGSTPGRYLVAVAPLLVVFVAEALRVWGHRRLVAATFVMLTLLSLETAVRYNRHHVKEVGPLVTRAFAAWRVNELFPRLGTETWEATTRDEILLGAWLAVRAGLVAAGWRASDGPRAPASASAAQVRLKPDSTTVRDAAVGLLALSVLGIAVARSAPSSGREWLVPARDARLAALTQFVQLDRCAVCYSSVHGAVPPTDALGNDIGSVNLQLAGRPPVSGDRAQILVRPRTPDGQFLVSTVRIDFGDGSVAAYNRWLGDVDERHVYQTPGDYVVHAWVRGGSATPMESRMTVHVPAGSGR